MLRRAKGLTNFVRYIEVLFHILYYYWGHGNHSLYRRTLLYRGSLYLGSTVHEYCSKIKCAMPEPCSILANLTQNPRSTACLDVRFFDLPPDRKLVAGWHLVKTV